MDSKHKVRIKLGNSEFEAEGDQEKVEEQLQRFLDIVSKVTSLAVSEAASAPIKPAIAEPQPPAAKPDGAAQPAVPSVPNDDRPPQEVIARTYKTERDMISLRVLPKSKSYAADTLLLLMYGHYVLKGQHDVLGGHLLAEGNQSGLKMDRVDRVLDAHTEFVQKGGRRRGARYGLNNRGLQKAKEMLLTLHE